jgi:hypothetical protein
VQNPYATKADTPPPASVTYATGPRYVLQVRIGMDSLPGELEAERKKFEDWLNDPAGRVHGLPGWLEAVRLDDVPGVRRAVPMYK